MSGRASYSSLKIQNYFIAKKLTFACAESCSGGLLAAALTHHPGSSHFFKMGLVTYDNHAKNKLLLIDPGLLSSKGAVSEEVAKLMAINCRKLSETNASLSITGIAGPDSDDKEGTVGLVYIGFSCINATEVKELHLKGNREQIRHKAVACALEFLLERLDQI